LGAHADDIEIGCGGTLLRLVTEVPDLVARWIVFSGAGPRGAEAQSSAAAFLEDVSEKQIEVLGFRDGYFPFQGADIKDCFEAVQRDFDPSLILTHWQHDAHQEHRLVAELTHNTFRDHLVLEYEIPKYDGDLGNPSFFVPLTQAQLHRKAETIRLAVEPRHSGCYPAWLHEKSVCAAQVVRPRSRPSTPGGNRRLRHARPVGYRFRDDKHLSDGGADFGWRPGYRVHADDPHDKRRDARTFKHRCGALV
jgi:LmbE family N-acetylglucosaminyl deacetylase